MTQRDAYSTTQFNKISGLPLLCIVHPGTMSTNKTSQTQTPSPSQSISHSLPPSPASIFPKETAAGASKSRKATIALPRRVQELKKSEQYPKHRSSQKYRVHKSSQKETLKKPEKDVYPMREVTVKTRHDKESFKLDVAICKYVQSIGHPRCCVSPYISSDPKTRTIVVRDPAFGCTPPVEYGVANVQLMKKTLKSYIKLLYRLGVGYSIKPMNIWFIGTNNPSYPGWALCLGRMMFADYCDQSERNDPRWEAKEKTQYARIDGIFRPMESLAVMSDERKAKQQMEERESDAAMKETDSLASDATATESTGS